MSNEKHERSLKRQERRSPAEKHKKKRQQKLDWTKQKESKRKAARKICAEKWNEEKERSDLRKEMCYQRKIALVTLAQNLSNPHQS